VINVSPTVWFNTRMAFYKPVGPLTEIKFIGDVLYYVSNVGTHYKVTPTFKLKYHHESIRSR
jgi:hypothetical protein